jgi:hypothetical protein
MAAFKQELGQQPLLQRLEGWDQHRRARSAQRTRQVRSGVGIPASHDDMM